MPGCGWNSGMKQTADVSPIQRQSESHGLWSRTAPSSSSLGALASDVAADVVVIGGGYTGLSTALHLRERNVSVVVLEAADIGFGGSGRNVGLVNAGMWVMPDAVVAGLGANYGNRLLELLAAAPGLVFEIIAQHSIECEATRCGTLHCGVGKKGLRELQQRMAQWQARNAPVELLNDDETRVRTGSAVFSGALFDPRAGTVQPLAYARGLAAAASAAGARIYIGSPALAAQRDERGWAVHCASGSVRAEWIVVATDAYAHGPWNVVRREQVHLPYFNFATTPLERSVRETILPRGEGAWDTRPVLSSFRLDAAGRLVFGSVGSLHGSGARVHEQWALRAIKKMFPQISRPHFESAWFGNIGMTADNLPRLHMFGPNVVGFNGYNGRGIAPGTVFGRVLADFISGRLRVEDLPLPVSEPHALRLRIFAEATYKYGAELLHLTGARI
jgi:glycine/D-amino acid oxidase-like deaminating enzyme